MGGQWCQCTPRWTGIHWRMVSGQGQFSKEDAWWFHYQVPLEDHPCADKEGDPTTRRISALELFGTLILTHFLLIKAGKALLRTRPSLISDNQGNIFALLNQRTKQMPTCSIRQGYNWLLHTWRGTTTSGLMNLLILTLLASDLTGNYLWARLFLWSLLGI